MIWCYAAALVWVGSAMLILALFVGIAAAILMNDSVISFERKDTIAWVAYFAIAALAVIAGFIMLL